MTRKLLFAAFVFTLTLTVFAAHHPLTNAAPNMAPPPRHAPPIEPKAVSSEPIWAVVAGGGGQDAYYNDLGVTKIS